jgi:outer membrane protein TolC
MLSLLPIFALAFAPPSPESTFWEARLSGPDLPVATARIEVDRAHAVVDTTLHYATRDLRVGWSVKGGMLDASSVQTRLSLPTFTLAPETPFPVTLRFLVDGREVLSGSFSE